MKKILIANDYLVGGGVENVLENMVRYLIKHNYDITLMIPNCSQQDIYNLFGYEINLYRPMRDLRALKRLSLNWFWDRFLYVIQHFIFKIIGKGTKS